MSRNVIFNPAMGKVVPNLQLFLLLLFISLVFFGLDSIRWLDFPKSAGYFVTNPISFSIYKARQAVSKQFYFIFEARNAAQDKKALQEQIGQLISENANLRKSLAETQAQLAQQQSIDPRTYDLLTAHPIGLDRYLRIDKGSNDGVKVGQAAIFKDNYLGQVIGVSQSAANIRLLADPDSKLAAFSIGKDGRAKGVLRGEFGLETILDKILHEEHIKQGDLVYSEGTEGFLPRGLIVGRVAEVLEKENEIFKQAKIRSVFDIHDLELVFLIKE